MSRQAVRHPRTAAALTERGRRPHRPTISAEIDQDTTLGEVYLDSLVRTQLRLALLAAGAVLLGIAGLLALPVFAPQFAAQRVVGLSLGWWAVSVATYPALLLCAWLYRRAADRAEGAFVALLGERDHP